MDSSAGVVEVELAPGRAGNADESSSKASDGITVTSTSLSGLCQSKNTKLNMNMSYRGAIGQLVPSVT